MLAGKKDKTHRASVPSYGDGNVLASLVESNCGLRLACHIYS